MNCKKIQQLVPSYADGQANNAERELVESHVRDCTACAGELQSTRSLLRLLADAPARTVSDSFEQKLMAALAETAPAPAPAAWWERFRLHVDWRFPMPARFAAGSLAAAMCAITLVVPRVAEYQAKVQERKQFMSSAMERHRELPSVNWDAMNASIDLNTGGVLSE